MTQYRRGKSWIAGTLRLSTLNRTLTAILEKTAENCALDEEDVHDVDPTAAQIEDDMPVVDTVFTLNGKPCSAVHPRTQAKYFGEPDEL